MPLEIHTLVLGPLETNCYVLRDVEEYWVVDPGLGPEPLLQFLRAAKASPRRILLTHGHGDHIAGVAAVKAAYPGARLCCPAGDAGLLSDPTGNLSGPFGFALTAPEADELLEPGQTLAMGQAAWGLLDTSGHTPGGMSFYCRQDGVVLTGDALFAGSIGRIDIPGASAGRLLTNIRRHLLTLPDATRVLPGHGPETTIGQERRNNPFLTGD